MIATLEGQIDDDSRDLKQLFRNLAELHETTSDRKWRINCRSCTYIGPWTASVLCAAYLKGRQLGQQPKVILPDFPPALAAYCAFSGMRELFTGRDPPDADHPNCETIPLEQFHIASWDRSNAIIRLLRRHTELDVNSEDQIRSCVQEVIQNVVDHSGSTIGGVMSARYFSGSREIRVGIVDRGDGIAAVLKKTHPDTTSSFVALTRVIAGGYTSRSRPNNMGLGVSNLFGMVRYAGGSVAIFTGDALAEVHRGASPQVCAMPFSFPGTAVFFTLPLPRPSDEM